MIIISFFGFSVLNAQTSNDINTTKAIKTNDNDLTPAEKKKIDSYIHEQFQSCATNVNNDNLAACRVLISAHNIQNQFMATVNNQFSLFCSSNEEYEKAHQADCNWSAMVNGLFYFGGNYGFKQDFQKALYWFLRSNPTADKEGDTQSVLAYIYMEGLAGNTNLNLAVYWYKNAYLNSTPKNRANIASELGNCYFVKGDYPAAFKYLIEGINGGEKNGWIFYELAMLYHQGFGVLQNNIQAYAWVNLAIVYGFDRAISVANYNSKNDARDIEQSALDLREQIKNQLLQEDSSGQVFLEAKKLAEQYYNKYLADSASLTN